VTDTATKLTARDNAVTNNPKSSVDEVIFALRNRTPQGVRGYLKYSGAQSRNRNLPDDVRELWGEKTEAINQYLKERDDERQRDATDTSY